MAILQSNIDVKSTSYSNNYAAMEDAVAEFRTIEQNVIRRNLLTKALHLNR